MAIIKSFEELHCWKACREIRIYVMNLAKEFPKEEKFDLVSNMKRAARSTTRNIAEGYGRFHHKENIQFCRITLGSLYELIDDFLIAKEENYITEEQLKKGRSLITDALKLTNGYIKYLKSLVKK